MFDQYDDAGRQQLHKFDTLLELPGFVKEADESDPSDLKGLPSSSYADPVHRKYPVHTRHDAWLSRLYFSKNKALYKNAAMRDVVEHSINTASEFWNLPSDYAVKPTMAKEAGASLTIPIENYNGDKIDDIRLSSPRDFEKAAIQMFENKNMFTYPQRHKVARTLIDNKDMFKDAKLAPQVSEYLEKAACEGLSTTEHVLSALQKRAMLYGNFDDRVADRMADLAEKVASEDMTPDLLDKVARVVDACDKSLDLFRHYKTGRLATPEDALVEMTAGQAIEKRASLVRLTNGRVLPIEKLSEAALDTYFDDIMGENPGGTHEEKLAAVRALPLPDANDFVKFIERS